MEQSNPSMRHLLFTLGRYVDMECNKWTPLVPQDSQVECFSRRADVVEWMLSLNKIFTFSDETYFLAVQIFDRVLIRIKVHMRYLTCIGLACLYLAAKLNEEDSDVPVTYDLIETSRCRFSEKELLRMERCLLDKLHWSLLSSPTSLQFIHLFYALVRAKCPSLHTSSDTNVPDVLTTALTRCLLHDELLNHSPSVVALSVFSLYLKMSWEHWLPAVSTLQALIKVSNEQLSQCNGLVEGFVGSYMREAVVKNSILSHLNLNNNSNNSVKQECSPSGPAAQEVQMMGSLSVFSNKTPLSNPVTPVPPAKRRRVEMDDEVYSDIRSLYEPSEPPRKFREVTPLMSYAAVVRSSCATEALQHGSSALALSLQRVASI